jgi:hypothetical protein
MEKKTEIHAVEMVRRIRNEQTEQLKGESTKEILALFRKAASDFRRRPRSKNLPVMKGRPQSRVRKESPAETGNAPTKSVPGATSSPNFRDPGRLSVRTGPGNRCSAAASCAASGGSPRRPQPAQHTGTPSVPELFRRIAFRRHPLRVYRGLVTSEVAGVSASSRPRDGRRTATLHGMSGRKWVDGWLRGVRTAKRPARAQRPSLARSHHPRRRRGFRASNAVVAAVVAGCGALSCVREERS